MRRTILTFAFLAAFTTSARADDDAKALLEKAIKAHGGAKNLEKYKGVTQKMKGDIHVMNMKLEFTGTWQIMTPDRARSEMVLTVAGNEIKVVNVITKEKGWTNVAGMKKKLSKDELAEAREDMHVGTATWLVPLRGKGYKLSLQGEAKIDGADAVGLFIEHKGRRDVTFYFDKKTHLLVKVQTRGKEPSGGDQEVSKEYYYSDYKAIDGLQTPHKVSYKLDGKDFFNAEVTEAKWEEKLDDDTFAEP